MIAPIVIVGYVVSALSGAVHLGQAVADWQAEQVAPAPLAAAPPGPPLCPKMTAVMDDDALNLIELSRTTGKCRHGAVP